jgi:hypothetical protein
MVGGQTAQPESGRGFYLPFRSSLADIINMVPASKRSPLALLEEQGGRTAADQGIELVRRVLKIVQIKLGEL